MNVGRLLTWCLFMVLAQLPVLNANLLSASEIDVLFLGDQGHHQPLPRFKQLRAALEPRGIRLTYTEDINQLNSKTLENYAALVLYANIDAIAEAPAKALLEFVEQGGGFVPLHCASYCFRNNEDVVNLIGAQFQRHGTGVFRTKTTEPTQPEPGIRHGHRHGRSGAAGHVRTSFWYHHQGQLPVGCRGD